MMDIKEIVQARISEQIGRLVIDAIRLECERDAIAKELAAIKEQKVKK